MPLTGELEHLPIVDVIQLIHSTRKSGILNVYSRKGEGKLVFENGYIVSASHSSEELRIGQILLETQLIDQAELDRALEIQQEADENDRKPLISTLIDECGMSKDSAYKALETLIEMTVVEMISWTKGIFNLDVDVTQGCDDYRYLPEQLQQVNMDTQMVLMDALRIFDEKVYSGEIKIATEALETDLQQSNELSEVAEPPEEIVLSDEILGLADLDKLEKKVPRVFKSLEAFDPAVIHRQVIDNTLPELADSEKKRFVSFLSDSSTPSLSSTGGLGSTPKSQAVIMYSHDDFLQHAVMTACKNEGILVFVSSQENELDNLISRSLEKCLEPILVFGSPAAVEGFKEPQLVDIRAEKMARFPDISVIQLASQTDYGFSLQALNAGVRAVFPNPSFSERRDTYADDMIEFLNSFQVYIRSCFNEERRQLFAKLRNGLSGLRLLHSPPDISLSVMQYVSEVFDRTLTLVVGKSELIAERSIGVITDKRQGVSAPLKFRIPLEDDSTLNSSIQSGKSISGATKDNTIEQHLFPEIGAPLESNLLILPLQSNERVVALIYADFGNQKSSSIPLDFLEFFASQASINLENALFRKQLNKVSHGH